MIDFANALGTVRSTGENVDGQAQPFVDPAPLTHEPHAKLMYETGNSSTLLNSPGGRRLASREKKNCCPYPVGTFIGRDVNCDVNIYANSDLPFIEWRKAARHNAAIERPHPNAIVCILKGGDRFYRLLAVALDPIGGIGPLAAFREIIGGVGQVPDASRSIREKVNQAFTRFSVLCHDRPFGEARALDDPFPPRWRRHQILSDLICRHLGRCPISIFSVGGGHGRP